MIIDLRVSKVALLLTFGDQFFKAGLLIFIHILSTVKVVLPRVSAASASEAIFHTTCVAVLLLAAFSCF